MRLFENTHYDFLGKRKKFYVVSIAIIVIGFAILLSAKSIPLGIDFSGGTEIQLKFQKDVDISELRHAMDESGFLGMEIKSMGSERDVLLRTPMQEEGQLVSDKIQEGIKSKIPDNTFEVLRTDKVGPKIGAELRRNALFAVLFSLIAILIYLSFRFQFVFAAASVIALFHDVLITVAVIAIADFIFPNLRLEFNQSMLAAFLTLVGFSSNDTVIVFDRIRENMKLYKNDNIIDVWFQSHARGQALFDIPARAFHPPPRVTSTVMWIEFEPTTPGIREIQGIEYIVQIAFAQKRKTLSNNLRSVPDITPAMWDALKSTCADLLTQRAEQLSAQDFARLALVLNPRQK